MKTSRSKKLRYEIRHFDYANGGRSWHVFDTVERYDIHTATVGHLREDKKCPSSCKVICAALNASGHKLPPFNRMIKELNFGEYEEIGRAHV